MNNDDVKMEKTELAEIVDKLMEIHSTLPDGCENCKRKNDCPIQADEQCLLLTAGDELSDLIESWSAELTL